MLTHVLISLLGAFIFLRIVGKEKNRRYRHLLLRVEAAKQKQAEQQRTAISASAPPAVADETPPETFEPIGQAPVVQAA